jgi:hypothetical protein
MTLWFRACLIFGWTLKLSFRNTIGTLFMCVPCWFHIYALLWYQIFVTLGIVWLVSIFVGLVLRHEIMHSNRSLRSWDNHQECGVVLVWVMYYKSLTSFILLWFGYFDVDCDLHFDFGGVMLGMIGYSGLT